jgi:ATP-dependent Clp protease ATP-binding subunit ClpB
MDAGNMIKPALARGLQLVGATTLDEYRKTIEKDAALQRRFQPIMVDEPSVESTISILRGLKSRFEVHFGVQIADSALVTAAVYSDRYVPDRYLPDKAIDLVDEASSALKLAQESRPATLETLDREIVTLEIERESLKNESDQFSVTRLETVDMELTEKKAEQKRISDLWTQERDRIGEIKAIKEAGFPCLICHTSLTVHSKSSTQISSWRIINEQENLNRLQNCDSQRFPGSRPNFQKSKQDWLLRPKRKQV